MVVPDAKTAFLGDLLFNEAHPSLWTASPDGWITILGQIEQMDLTTVVPGHGPVGTLATVSTLKRYWEEMRSQADSLVRGGASADDVARTTVSERYADWRWADGYSQTLRAQPSAAIGYDFSDPRKSSTIRLNSAGFSIKG
jgi:cyclase